MTMIVPESPSHWLCMEGAADRLRPEMTEAAIALVPVTAGGVEDERRIPQAP